MHSDTHLDPALRGQPKGMEVILRERGLWPEGRFNRVCKQCKTSRKEDPTRDSRTNCCALRLLASQPDFMQQTSQLEEKLTAQGLVVAFFPKYHCELNYIEHLWCYSKRTVRQTCDYSHSSLMVNVPKSLRGCPLGTIRRFERRMWRMVQLYSRELPTALAMYATKKYRGHRVIPEFVVKELETELQMEKEKEKEKK